jgi:hypothetical protein
MTRRLACLLAVMALVVGCRKTESVAWCPASGDSLVGNWEAHGESQIRYGLELNTDGTVSVYDLPARFRIPRRWQYAVSTCTLTFDMQGSDSGSRTVKATLQQSPPRIELAHLIFTR